MRCRRIISYLNAYVDGELPGRRRRIVETHLAECGSCRVRLEEILGIDALFEGALPVPPVPDGLAARIMAEARRRQPVKVPVSPSLLPVWSLLQLMDGFSAPLRLAACATVLLALVTGLALDGTRVIGRNVLMEQGKELYGLEWFAPVPPNSIGSIYLAMAGKPYERGR